jgi:serine/threonine protein kinase
VAVKTVTFQDRTSGSQKSQQRAMLEAAITSSISHPNVVSTYSYDIQPLNASSAQTRGGWHVASSVPLQMATDWKLFIVQEYCNGGSLRQALDNRVFWDGSSRQPKLVRGQRRGGRGAGRGWERGRRIGMVAMHGWGCGVAAGAQQVAG